MVNQVPTRLRSRGVGWLGACALATALLLGCGAGPDDAGPPATLAGGEGIEAPTTTAEVPALVEEVPAFDPGTEAIVATLTALVPLTDEQRICVSAALDGDPDLREAIGDRGQGADRWRDVLGISTDCITTVSFSAEFARSQQLAHEGNLTEEQVACLRHGMADLGAADIRRIGEGTTTGDGDPELEGRIRGLIEGCGVTVVEVTGA